MPKNHESLRDKVVRNISVVSGFPESSIKDNSRLFQDLLMAHESRRALAPGFQAIAREVNPHARITKTDCEKLKTVGAAVNLVEKQTKN